ncbi:PAAR domain-containing protein [uncultured Roseibium sp.]|uniref:PAAR domain-containing protein n=1 Tax=uncultured Roseibium sp. TaxID=1936171 RepID=UPI002608F2D6|nr:PAAR domain-containing protein [uncultured Roseibium sp.]
MPPAARILDKVAHTPALAALIGGAILGALAGAAIVATGGAAALAIAAAAASGASLGGGLGQFIGSFFSITTGTITGACSPNVFVGKRPAARATIDFSMCSGLPFSPFAHPNALIAQGSISVFVNKFNAAREKDKLICGAVISSGCKSVIIGDRAATTLPIQSEVPAWLEWGLLALGVVGGAGLLRMSAKLTWVGVGRVLGAGFLGSYVSGQVGGWLGGKIFGEGSDGQKIMGFAAGVIGGLVVGAWAFKGAPRLPIATSTATKTGGKYATKQIKMTERYLKYDRQHGVKYLNEAELAAHRVVADRDGNLIYAESGRPVNTDKGIYVMDEHGNVFVHENPRSEMVHHSSFNSGQPIAAGGNIKVRNGKLAEIDEGTGHYGDSQPVGRVNLVTEELGSQGVNVKGAEVNDYNVMMQKARRR